jgi:type IV pilus assembly protein PilE
VTRKARERKVKHKKQDGFGLVELLTVLVIISILAGLALPAYRDSVRKSGRTAAKGTLMDVALRQEQHFLNNRSYSANLAGLGLPDPYFVDKTNETVTGTDTRRIYKITLANTSATSYDAVATAQLDQAEDSCGNYTLKEDGTRQVSGSIGASVCW